jgi:hypothetical protein
VQLGDGELLRGRAADEQGKGEQEREEPHELRA